MTNPAFESIADEINALYEGQLTSSESLEAAGNLAGFVGLLLEIAMENGGSLDDVPA
jgi:hypothetical protein